MGKEIIRACVNLRVPNLNAIATEKYHPTKPSEVRIEASFNEGLSVGLFQKTVKGNKPVFFISRTMTETERCYIQTKKDAWVMKGAKDRYI